MAAKLQVFFAECAPVPVTEVLPDASPAALDLLQGLLQWDPGDVSGDSRVDFLHLQ